MKKIFTLCMLAMLAVAQLSAQKLKITCAGQDYEMNGNNVVVTFNNAKPMGGRVLLGDLMEPTITNINDEELTIDGIMNTSKNAYNGVFEWCGFDGQCTNVDGGRAEKDGLKLAPGASANMQVHTYVSAGAYGTYSATIKLFNNTYDLLGTLTLVYNYNDPSDPTGINDVTVENKSVVVANNTLNYAFDSAAARTISVFSIDGKVVKRINTTAQQGELSLNGLQKGAYVYTIAQEGQQVISGKALVK